MKLVFAIMTLGLLALSTLAQADQELETRGALYSGRITKITHKSIYDPNVTITFERACNDAVVGVVYEPLQSLKPLPVSEHVQPRVLAVLLQRYRLPCPKNSPQVVTDKIDYKLDTPDASGYQIYPIAPVGL